MGQEERGMGCSKVMARNKQGMGGGGDARALQRREGGGSSSTFESRGRRPTRVGDSSRLSAAGFVFRVHMRAGRGQLQNQGSPPLCQAYDFILESHGAFPRPFDICAALGVSVVACPSLLATPKAMIRSCLLRVMMKGQK